MKLLNQLSSINLFSLFLGAGRSQSTVPPLLPPLQLLQLLALDQQEIGRRDVVDLLRSLAGTDCPILVLCERLQLVHQVPAWDHVLALNAPNNFIVDDEFGLLILTHRNRCPRQGLLQRWTRLLLGQNLG